MHPEHLSCRDRCRCRRACLCLSLVSLLAGLALAAGLHAVDRKVEATKKAIAGLATRGDLDGLRSEGMGLFGGLKSDIERSVEDRVAALAKDVHARRKALADELREEISSAVEKVRSAVAAETVIRGQQITSERGQRRQEDGQLARGLDHAFDALKFHQVELEKIAKKFVGLEKLWLDHRCPEPCKCSHVPAPAAAVPPVAPLSQVYTIPYPWSYERPRWCPK